MEKRELGTTKEQLPVVGFGGIVVMDVEPKSLMLVNGYINTKDMA